jgi:hypothetical protein
MHSILSWNHSVHETRGGSDRLRVAHFSGDRVETTWIDAPLLDQRIALHSAYLFLAFLLVGVGHEAVLDGRSLNAVRTALRDPTASLPGSDVVLPVSCSAEPAHIVTLRPREDHLAIGVQFFGAAAWEVRLPPVELPAPLEELGYVHDLTTQQQVIQKRSGGEWQLAPGAAA